MKGTEHVNAVNGINRVLGLTYYRPETVHRAVGATLGYIGARRLEAAIDEDPEGAGDRRLLQILSDAESLAARLDAIPQRSEHAQARAEVWSEIVGHLGRVKVLLERERKTAKVAARLATEVA